MIPHHVSIWISSLPPPKSSKVLQRIEQAKVVVVAVLMGVYKLQCASPYT
jgi:hypothetical protein